MDTFHPFCICSIFLVAKEFARSWCSSECRILDEYRAGSHFQTSDSCWISNLYFQHSRSHDIEILLSNSCPDNLFVASEGHSFPKAIHFEMLASLKWNKVTIVKGKLLDLKDFLALSIEVIAINDTNRFICKWQMTSHLHGPNFGDVHDENQMVFFPFKRPFAEERACLCI